MTIATIAVRFSRNHSPPKEEESRCAQVRALQDRRIGSTAGNALTLAGDHPIPLAKFTEWFEGFLPAYMAGEIGAH